MYWCKSSFSISSNRNCFSLPWVIWSRWRSLLLGLRLSWRLVCLISLLSVVNRVALISCSACCLAAAHSRHSHHSEVSSHSVVEKHTFEFSVSEEAQNDCHYVVDCQQANNRKLKGSWSCPSAVNAADGACLNTKADDIDEREKVDSDVNHVES